MSDVSLLSSSLSLSSFPILLRQHSILTSRHFLFLLHIHSLQMSALSGGAIAGIVIGVLVLCAIGVGVRTHLNNKKKNSASLLKNLSEHGFEEVRVNHSTSVKAVKPF